MRIAGGIGIIHEECPRSLGLWHRAGMLPVDTYENCTGESHMCQYALQQGVTQIPSLLRPMEWNAPGETPRIVIPNKEADHGTVNLERSDQLRAGEYPRKLFTAVRSHEHSLSHAPRQGRRPRAAKAGTARRGSTNRAATRSVKGYEVAPDQYVTVEDKELEAACPRSRAAINITRLRGPCADRPDLLRPPLLSSCPTSRRPRPTGSCWTRWSSRARSASPSSSCGTRSTSRPLRPGEGVIMLEIMHFADEVVEPSTSGRCPPTSRSARRN